MKQKYIDLKRWTATAVSVILFSMAVTGQTLMHSYSFDTDGSAADETGTLDGTLNGAVTVSGGYATVDAGAADQGQNYGYISFDGTALGLAAYSAITLEAMIVCPDAGNDSYTMLSYFGANTANYLFTQLTVGGNDQSTVKTTGADGEVGVFYNRVDDGKLHHIVVVLTPTSLKYYLDGTMVDTASGTGMIATIGTDFANLFRGPDGWNDDNWIGSIDQYNIYDGEMDAETIGFNADAYVGQVDTRLSAIDASAGTLYPTFDPGVKRYQLVLPMGTTSANLVPTTKNVNATFTGGGLIDASAGSVVDVIEVTAADGVTKDSYTVIASVTEAPDAAKLTHQYTFDDGTTMDAVGDVDGVMMGGATVKNGALVLSANGDFVALDGKSIDIPSYDGVTVEAWYTPQGGTNTNFHAVFAFGGSNSSGQGINYFQFQPARGDNNATTAVSCKKETNPWEAENGVSTAETDDAMMHHVVSVLDDNGITQYVDGVYNGFTAFTGNNAIDSLGNDTAFIGRSVYLGDETWKGAIQEMKIYNSALTMGQATYLYDMGLEDAGVSMDISYYGAPTDGSDFYAASFTTWDADSIYVTVNVTDDILDVSHANNWERDKVELYFDMDNSKIDKNSGYDGNDKQLGFEYNADYSTMLNGAVNAKSMKTATGWTLDVAIPWDSLQDGFTPAEGMVIGYDVQAIDADSSGSRESKLATMALGDNAWTNPAWMGEMEFMAGGKVKYIYPEFKPWSGYTGVPMNIEYYTDVPAADFSATSKTIWDMDSIYVRVDVTDDSLNTAHANNWERDKVELYFDMDNSKIDMNSGYDGNDIQIGFEYDADYSGILNGAVNARSWATATGWSLQVAIPWDSLMMGFNPAVDKIIGYDVQAIDNDGANRESKLATMALADNAWTNPAWMGEMKFLADHMTEYIYPEIVPTSAVTGYALKNSFYADPTDAADFSVMAYTSWDMKNIYVHVDVTDDSLDADHANSWERDMVELYFDMDNSKINANSGYDDNDYQFGFVYGADSAYTDKATASSMATETGWALDVTIPWDSLMMGFMPAEGDTIGYDVQAIDNDGGNRESKLSMMAIADNAWTNPSFMGELTFLSGGQIMPIYYTVFNVDVSGLIDKGLFTAGTDMVDIAGSFNNWGDPVMNMADSDGDGIYTIALSGLTGDLEFKFRINGSWDFADGPGGGPNRTLTVASGTNVVDAVFNDGDYSPWLEEVTFNVDMNDLIDADLFVAGTDSVDVAGTFNNWGDPVMALSDDDNDGIYTITVSLPQGDISFKFRVNGLWDPDGISEFPNGGADRTYTVVDGTNVIDVTFNDGDISPWTGIERYNVSNVRIYPNPATSVLHMDNVNNITRIELVNLVGQVTASYENDGRTNLTIPVNSQRAGVYMIRFTGSDNSISYQKVVIE
jgi:hypothetical protein